MLLVNDQHISIEELGHHVRQEEKEYVVVVVCLLVAGYCVVIDNGVVNHCHYLIVRKSRIH